MKLAELPQIITDRLSRANDNSPALSNTGSVLSISVGNRNNSLTSLAGTLRRRGLGDETLSVVLQAFNATLEDPLPSAEVESVARSVSRYEPHADLNEVELSQKFASLVHERIRYSSSRGWMVFEGKVWIQDNKGLHVQEEIKEMLLLLKARLQDAEGVATEDRKTLLKALQPFLKKRPISDIARLAGSDQRLFDRGHWDDSPNLLNFQNGTLDMRDMTLREHSAADRMERILPFNYDPTAECPTFDMVLEGALEPDEARFLLRVFGYGLSGTGQEQKFVAMVGAGGEGKSTLAQAIAGAMACYATTANPETFMKSNFKGSINNDVAAFAGARLVSTSELNPGQVLDSALVKRLTGGEEIRARFLYQENFGFFFKALLMFTANSLPVLDGSDYALQRRLLVLRFTRRVARVDPELPQKLKVEGPGILNRLLNGYAEYRQIGLDPPQSVLRETEKFMADSNPVGRFLNERCIMEAAASENAGPLLGAYRAWCMSEGLKPMSAPAFNEVLRRTGLQQAKRNYGMVWLGIKLRPGLPGM